MYIYIYDYICLSLKVSRTPPQTTTKTSTVMEKQMFCTAKVNILEMFGRIIMQPCVARSPACVSPEYL